MTALAPGVYIQEVNTGANVIQAEGTSTAGFAGFAHRSVHVGEAVAVNGWREYCRLFASDNQEPTPMALAVYGYFSNGGKRCWIANTGKPGDYGSPSPRTGIHRLEEVDDVAIVVAPGAASACRLRHSDEPLRKAQRPGRDLGCTPPSPEHQ